MEINSPIAKKWLKCSSNNLHQRFWAIQWQEYYKKRLSEYKGQMEDIISKDVNRSWYGLGDYPIFQKQARRDLQNVLHAYCAYDNEVGYTQGMSFIVERLLSHLSPYQAYIVWLGILKTDDFRDFYTNEFGERLSVSFKETVADIRVKFPYLTAHIETLSKTNRTLAESEPLFIFYNLYTQISMTLGCNLPIKSQIKDTIITEFLENRNKTQTTTVLLFGVLSVLENRILKLKTSDDIYLLMNSDSLEKILRGEDILKNGKNVQDNYPVLMDFDMTSSFW